MLPPRQVTQGKGLHPQSTHDGPRASWGPRPDHCRHDSHGQVDVTDVSSNDDTIVQNTVHVDDKGRKALTCAIAPMSDVLTYLNKL